MNSLTLFSQAHSPNKPSPVTVAISPVPGTRYAGAHARKQRGVVLFFTLIALLAMSLAAVALIRSVDTSTLIAGNLAFKQASTTSADGGTWIAMDAVWAKQNAANPALDINQDAAFPTNQTNLAVTPGYDSSFNPNLDVMADATWDGNHAAPVAADDSGNEARYIIQRMCRNPNVPLPQADCIIGGSPPVGRPVGVVPAPKQCEEEDKCGGGQPAVTRITVRTKGPNNSVSYVQGFTF